MFPLVGDWRMFVELRTFCAFIKASTLNTGGRVGPRLALIGLNLVLSALPVLLLSTIFLLLLFSFLLSLITRERGSSWGGGGELGGEGETSDLGGRAR